MTTTAAQLTTFRSELNEQAVELIGLYASAEGGLQRIHLAQAGRFVKWALDELDQAIGPARKAENARRKRRQKARVAK